jgi:hypothetical protein
VDTFFPESEKRYPYNRCQHHKIFLPELCWFSHTYFLPKLFIVEHFGFQLFPTRHPNKLHGGGLFFYFIFNLAARGITMGGTLGSVILV